jgi:hypothetical protein
MSTPVTPNPPEHGAAVGGASSRRSSARLALGGGALGAAAGLALQFIAGGAGQSDAAAALGGAALLACGAIALRGDRGRGPARGLLAVLILGGGWILSRGAELPAPLSREVLDRSSGWLLVTVEDTPRHERDVGTEMLWIAPSTHLPGNLAGVLTGHHPLEMGWPLGAGQGAPRPRGGPPTLGEHQAALGFECALFGGEGLPGWARADAEPHAGGLMEALQWIASREGAPRFAHVHLATCSAEEVAAGRQRCDELSLPAAVVWLEGSAPEEGVSARFLTGSVAERRVAFWGVPHPELPGERPATSLCRSGVALLDVMSLPAPGPSNLPAVQFEVGPPDRPHRLFARFDDARQDHLDLAIEVTPLGPDPVRDWQLGGAPQESLAFRNVVRARWGSQDGRGEEPRSDEPGEAERQRMATREVRSIEGLEAWRRQIAGDEDPVAPVR